VLHRSELDAQVHVFFFYCFYKIKGRLFIIYGHYVRPDHGELFKAKVRELGKHQVEITAPASLVFVGDINVSIETALRTSHLHFLLKLYNHQDVVINIV